MSKRCNLLITKNPNPPSVNANAVLNLADTAHQLMDVTESKITHLHLSKKRQAGKLKFYSRKIQPCWYKKYPWITVCMSKYKVFCVSCRSAKQQVSKRIELVWMSWIYVPVSTVNQILT